MSEGDEQVATKAGLEREGAATEEAAQASNPSGIVSLVSTAGDAVDKRLLPMLEASRQPLDVGMLLGSYRLQACLSHNRNSIWRAHDERLNRAVVVRVFDPEQTSPSNRLNAARAFWDGACIMARLDRVARCPTLLDGPEISDGWLWCVIDYYQAGDLRSALERGVMETEHRERAFEEVLSAVAELHRAGCVHRDVCLENVLLMRAGDGAHAYLSDFDAAAARSDFESPGSAKYYPARDGSSGDAPLTARRPKDDVYALCVLLFELFTSPDTLLPGPTRKALHKALTYHDADPIARARVARICERGLNEPGFRSAVELREAWQKRGAERWAAVTGLVIAVCALTTFLIVADWLMAPNMMNKWLRAVSPFLGATGVAGILLAIYNLLKPRMPDLYGKCASWSGAYPRRAVAVAVGLVTATLGIGHATRLGERLESYYFTHTKSCWVINKNDAKIDLKPPQPIRLPNARFFTCTDPKNDNAMKPDHWGASFLTLELEWRDPQEPDPAPPCSASPIASGGAAPLPTLVPPIKTSTEPPPPASVASLPRTNPSARPVSSATAASISPPPVATATALAQTVCNATCEERYSNCSRGCNATYRVNPDALNACSVYCSSQKQRCLTCK